LRDPISKKKKNLHQKRAGEVAQGADPEFKPSITKKKTKLFFLTLVINLFYPTHLALNL
jgi:hypothetical protein